MNIFIDCEFDGQRLLSLAMVSDLGEYYEVVEKQYANPDPWVRQNVWPVLGPQEPIGYEALQISAAHWINGHEDACIIADWPSDIEFICRVLNLGNGNMYPIRKGRLSFLLDCRLSSSKSKIPHNALADARAIRECAAKIAAPTHPDEKG